jgi:hypothetical protein
MAKPRKRASERAASDSRLAKVKAQVEEFLVDTQSARTLSERDRDYIDGKQWTDEEARKLRERSQAPIVVNRIRPKHNGLLGLWSLRKSDPKAYARTKKHEKSSEAVTDALRYVMDNNDFNETARYDVADSFFGEGYGGAIVRVKAGSDGKPEIFIEPIHWDRIYFQAASRKRDFSDARYKGMILWMDAEEVPQMFEGVSEEDVDSLLSASHDRTFEDRPRWVDKARKRVRVALHYFKENGVWNYCAFTDGRFLVEPTESPYLDEFGKPCCPIELVGAYINRDNDRYGEVRGFIDQQDEINHRRSKALFLLSARQTAARQGAVKDIDELKRELAKPNGHVQYQGEKGDFEILQTGDMAQGQFELYQDAKAELDAVSFNAQLAGERQSGNLSGRAIDRLQQAGTIELNGLYNALTGWERRIYRQVWARIKQFWDEEKWIRVTDDHENLRWVGLNTEISTQEWLEEIINDDALPQKQRKQAAASYQYLMQAAEGVPEALAAIGMQDAQEAQAVLENPVAVRNPVPELDVDIVLDQSFDTVSVKQEQFEMLAKFASSGEVDIIDLIELSEVRNKSALIDKIEKRRESQNEAQGNLNQIKAYGEQAKAQKVMSEMQLNAEKTMQARIENQILASMPPDIRPQVQV